MNFCPIIYLVVYAVKTRKFLPRFGRNLTIDFHSAHWRSKMDWKVAILIPGVNGNHFCTSYKNLLRFGSVTLEFKT